MSRWRAHCRRDARRKQKTRKTVSCGVFTFIRSGMRREYCDRVVPRRGLEPPHLAAHGPEPCASTNSATWARFVAALSDTQKRRGAIMPTFFGARKFLRNAADFSPHCKDFSPRCKDKAPDAFPHRGLCEFMVPRRGLEPPHLAAHGPEPCASTNSATWALYFVRIPLLLCSKPLVFHPRRSHSAESAEAAHYQHGDFDFGKTIERRRR